MEIWIIFVLAGLLAGFMAGLLGIGGGFILVPVFVWVLPLAGVNEAHVSHMAIGTSLLCICITALSSTRAHHRRQAVDWSLFKLTVPGLIVGALVGAQVAAWLKGPILIALFVLGACCTAIYLLWGHQPKAHPTESRWPFVGYAGFTGAISALIGIGGGSVLVPFLVYKGKPVIRAVGTAAACGIPIALFGAGGFAFTGMQQGVSTPYAIGFLYLPAFLGIVIFSGLSAPLGAKVAHLVSERRLKQCFAAFLFFTSGQILYSQWF